MREKCFFSVYSGKSRGETRQELCWKVGAAGCKAKYSGFVALYFYWDSAVKDMWIHGKWLLMV